MLVAEEYGSQHGINLNILYGKRKMTPGRGIAGVGRNPYLDAIQRSTPGIIKFQDCPTCTYAGIPDQEFGQLTPEQRASIKQYVEAEMGRPYRVGRVSPWHVLVAVMMIGAGTAGYLYYRKLQKEKGKV